MTDDTFDTYRVVFARCRSLVNECCEGQPSVKNPSETLMFIFADVPRGALFHGQMVQWAYMDRSCGLTAGSQPH